MIHAHFCKDLGNGCWVGNVGVTGASALTLVGQCRVTMRGSNAVYFLLVQIGEVSREGIYGRRGCDFSLLSVRSKLRYKV